MTRTQFYAVWTLILFGCLAFWTAVVLLAVEFA